MKDLDRKHQTTIDIYTVKHNPQSLSRSSGVKSRGNSKKRDGSNSASKEKYDRALNVSCFTNDFKDFKSSLQMTCSDSSTPVRGSKGEFKLNKERMSTIIDIHNNSMDTKRPSSYSKQKKFISRNTQLKESRTSKDESMVTVIERKIMERLKVTERSKFDQTVLEQRFSIIEDCMNSSICKLIRLNFIGEIYPALQSTMKILLDEIKNLFQKQERSFHISLDATKQEATKYLLDLQQNELALATRTQELETLKKSMSSEIKTLKEQHKKEVQKLNQELKRKNSELMANMKKFIMHEIDLDEYNITSDDFRQTKIGSKGMYLSHKF